MSLRVKRFRLCRSPVFLWQVREATSNDPWGPSSSQMADISDLTYNVVACNEIMTMLWKRLKDDRNWRHIHKVSLRASGLSASASVSGLTVPVFTPVPDAAGVPAEDRRRPRASEDERQHLHRQSPHRISLRRKGRKRSGDAFYASFIGPSQVSDLSK